ncbi:MAG TPA: aminomethyl-transferring glycine dehydrogenase subunit GcvPA [Syntrophomonadaceae bacterium]|nr:aminomethyl-transferring glycine dehydrogenase subunit GcvPA [Syntrophomonadaceae bacterium]HQA06554.1 aminomethyl-transferring glycine dehydrogenase subunit GcvPA [Syntrophomonadaceae bacterium]HQE22465.1 aminomethyl-transferring glycine dehydrogenase subunit GcvPA [Syntrophomonadaceae bacterium]
MRFTPNTDAVVQEMLESLGLQHIEELFEDIPDEVKMDRPLDLPPEMSEIELKSLLTALAARNVPAADHPCFLGAGAYDSYIPAALEQLLLRSEFYTSYTPYQPEISQGILQGIFEYQTMICQLTEMDVSNASLYDGATALAEACTLAAVHTRKKLVVVPETVHPEYKQVLETYALSGHFEPVFVPCPNGIMDLNAVSDLAKNQAAALVVQHPNFFGHLEPVGAAADLIHEAGGLLIMAVDPLSLAILKPPGAWGADIAVGEGQPLGNPLSFGGPYLGFMAVTRPLMRKIPGRIVGQTTDLEDRRGFVLTLQAREQHIRREKAGSNICSNQALNALAAAIYLTLMGPRGLKQIALRCHQLAVYAQKRLEEAGFPLLYNQPFFREFAVKTPDAGSINRRLQEQGIIGGLEIEGGMLLAFTEKRSRQDIDRLVAAFKGE